MVVWRNSEAHSSPSNEDSGTDEVPTSNNGYGRARRQSSSSEVTRSTDTSRSRHTDNSITLSGSATLPEMETGSSLLGLELANPTTVKGEGFKVEYMETQDWTEAVVFAVDAAAGIRGLLVLNEEGTAQTIISEEEISSPASDREFEGTVLEETVDKRIVHVEDKANFRMAWKPQFGPNGRKSIEAIVHDRSQICIEVLQNGNVEVEGGPIDMEVRERWSFTD